MAINIGLIRVSFERVRRGAADFTEKLFTAILEDSTAVNALFSGANMEKAKREFFDAFAFVIDHMDDQEKIDTHLRNLGRRHVNYRVQTEHYESMGQGFLKTLSTVFPTQWEGELQVTWGEMFGYMTHQMATGAAQVLGVAPPVEVENVPETLPAPATVTQMEAPTPPELEPVVPKQETPSPVPDNVVPFQVNGADAPVALLPDKVTDELRQAVRSAIQKAVHEEMERIIAEEIAALTPASITALLKKAS